MENLSFARQNLPRAETLADAVWRAAREMWPQATVANLATFGKCSKDTATNISKGHASGRTLAHVIANVGIEFGLRVIEITVGDSFDAHFAREAERARRREAYLETTRNKLVESRRRRADLGARLRDGLGR